MLQPCSGEARWPWLIAVALALTSATQVRLPGWPIGAGELLLCLWLVGLLGLTAWSREIPRVLNPGMSLFWVASFLGLAIGFANSLLQDVSPPPGQRLYDTAALAFCAAISMALPFEYGRRTSARSALHLGLAIAIPFVCIWLVALTRENVAFVSLWSDYQYLGWAANHNQAALVLLPAPFLLLHFLEQRGDEGPWASVVLLGVLIGAVAVAGWATSSRAFRLTVIISTLVLLVGLALLWTQHRQRTAPRLLVATLVAIIVAVCGNGMFGPDQRQVHPEESSAKGMSLDAFQASVLNRGQPGMPTYEVTSVRGPLLLHGLAVIGDSKLLGFGPGSFSGLDEAYQGSEVHNSFLDWFVRTGLLGITSLIVLLLRIGLRLWRRRCYVLLLGLLSLLFFAQFHFVLRHPIVWAYLTIAWIAGEWDKPPTS